jgi:hypothetical protein
MLEDCDGTRAQRDHAIRAGLGAVFIGLGDTGFVHSQGACGRIEVSYGERDLLGRS